MNLEVSVSKNKKGIFHSNNGGYLHFDVIVLNRLIFYHESKIVTERFEIIEQVHDCRVLFERLQASLSSTW